MAELDFNANEVEPSASFDPLPAGDYLATIVKSQMKFTKAADGQYLELEFEIIEGDHKSRKLWANLNLKNKSEKAVQIAKAELSSICRAVGVMMLKDSAELHNKPIALKVSQVKRQDTGELTNKIKGYYAPANASEPMRAAASGAGQTSQGSQPVQQQAADDSKPPWMR